MPGLYTEADYENSVIELFRNDLGYEYVYGPDILHSLNSGLPEDAIQDALHKLKNIETESLCRKTRSLRTICKTVFR